MQSLWQELPIELWQRNSKRDSWRLGGEVISARTLLNSWRKRSLTVNRRPLLAVSRHSLTVNLGLPLRNTVIRLDLNARRPASQHFQHRRGRKHDGVDGRERVSEYVFSYNGQPLTRVSNHAWRKARTRAGLPRLRFHDMRHTFGHRLRAVGVSNEDRHALLGTRLGTSPLTTLLRS